MKLCDNGHPAISFDSWFGTKQGYCQVCEARLEIERHEKEEERLRGEIKKLQAELRDKMDFLD